VICFEGEGDQTMNEPHDPNRTVDVPSTPADSLDAGLAAGFGRPADGPDSVLSALRDSLGPLRPLLLKEAEGDSAHVVKPQSDAMPAKDEIGDRYQLQGEIARGGMGAVLRGRDVDLGRDLAVKVLLAKHAHRPEVARRFIEEAQIGGQLQHPGVVPVYDIGRFGERPFFTMKLVKGQTLAHLLAERNVGQASSLPEATPAGWKPAPPELPRFLGILLQVAQTLAYAHAKGVIHRDLKPANIMVGAFGEVQVMDWGLAKVLAEGGVADEERASRQHQQEEGTQIRTARSGGTGFGSDTEAGTLLGTPAYMPPEQANGDVANLDRRADVFGLGAILCEVLTGKPPYVGRSAEEVRRKAANGDLADATARLDGCGVDAELIALTKSCLSPEASDRPRDARAVADALTAYQGGVQQRLHQAELAEAEARARAVEEARRRRLTLALAATVLLALTLGGGGWLYVKNERDARQAQLTRDINDALNKATALREQARTANVGSALLFGQAREQAQRALALVATGPADATLVDQVRQLQTELEEEQRDRRLLAALDDARLAQAENVVREDRFAWERAVPLFRKAFREYGLPAGQAEPAAAIAMIRQRPAFVRESILAALDEWICWAEYYRPAIDEPALDWLRAVADAADLVEGWTGQMRAVMRLKDRGKRRASLERLASEADVRKLPAQVVTLMAIRLIALQSVASAQRLLRKAQAQNPGDFWLNYWLGSALGLTRTPESDDALRFLTAAVALRPENSRAHHAVGIFYKDRGRHEEASACYRKAIQLEPNYAVSYTDLGVMLHCMGRIDEAITYHRKAIELDGKHWMAHNNLGFALNATGRHDEAIASLLVAIKLDPRNPAPYNNLGVAYAKKGRLDDAAAHFHKSMANDPQHVQAYANLGNVMRDRGRLDEAIDWYHKAIEIDPKHVPAYICLGDAMKARNQLDKAIDWYRKAIAIDPKHVAAHGNLGTALERCGKVELAIASYRKVIEIDPNHADAHAALGQALVKLGQVDEAITCYRKTIALDPKRAIAHSSLGVALSAKGQVDEAIACHRKAIDLDPKKAAFHRNLGAALQRKRRFIEAITCYRKAIELDAADASTHTYLGIALKAVGQLDGAIESYRKAIELDPRYPLAHGALGEALFDKGRFTEARDALTRSLELFSKDDRQRTVASKQLRKCERFVKLEERLPRFLREEDKPGSARECLDLAQICAHRQLLVATVRFCAAAFDRDPKLADNLTTRYRYQAACDAAMAAAGQGKDAVGLDEKERARLRKQALDWLRADLAQYEKQLDRGTRAIRRMVRQQVQQWQTKTDLAGIRDRSALAKLPAEERAAFTKLWADVATLLKKAETPAPKEGKR
jgi:serine/threonine-protein kinase